VISLGVFVFFVGVLVGAIGIARFWTWRMHQPEVAREALKSIYRQSHPHWLQRSADDKTPVCPCCGWSETEGLAQKEAPKDLLGG
jgi:hypothetical protein